MKRAAENENENEKKGKSGGFFRKFAENLTASEPPLLTNDEAAESAEVIYTGDTGAAPVQETMQETTQGHAGGVPKDVASQEFLDSLSPAYDIPSEIMFESGDSGTVFQAAAPASAAEPVQAEAQADGLRLYDQSYHDWLLDNLREYPEMIVVMYTPIVPKNPKADPVWLTREEIEQRGLNFDDFRMVPVFVTASADGQQGIIPVTCLDDNGGKVSEWVAYSFECLWSIVDENFDDDRQTEATTSEEPQSQAQNGFDMDQLMGQIAATVQQTIAATVPQMIQSELDRREQEQPAQAQGQVYLHRSQPQQNQPQGQQNQPQNAQPQGQQGQPAQAQPQQNQAQGQQNQTPPIQQQVQPAQAQGRNFRGRSSGRR